MEKEIGKLRKYIISQIKLQKITLQQSIWKQENKFKKYLIILCIHHIYILHSNTWKKNPKIFKRTNMEKSNETKRNNLKEERKKRKESLISGLYVPTLCVSPTTMCNARVSCMYNTHAIIRCLLVCSFVFFFSCLFFNCQVMYWNLVVV